MSDAPTSILVAGASGGIGGAIMQELHHLYPQARLWATHFRGEVRDIDADFQALRVDLTDDRAVAKCCDQLERVDWVINCVGMLHDGRRGPEKSIRNLEPEFALDNFRINTLPTLLLGKHLSRPFKSSPAPRFATISARVGSIEDNRLGGWYSYRMSKAALNMVLKTLSLEWRHSHPRGCVAALHPGTNDTALSKPFQANLPATQLLDPSDSARQMVALLQGLTPSQSGRFWAWDGTELPW